MIDEFDLRALHVEAMRAEDLHGGNDSHVLFQASTIGALLDGTYDGDVTFAELAEHGDTGLGTLNALDGEMIAIDGRFYRADVDGAITEVEADARTPFAVVGWLEPRVSFPVDAPTDRAGLLAELDRHLPPGSPACLVRIDGEFSTVRARSVPRQEQPYRPLAEAIADQHRFEFHNIAGSMVGFRFPAYAEGIEVAGYHLHFIDESRTRGGHVLDFGIESGTLTADPSCELRLELPPGIDLAAPTLASDTHAAIRGVEE